MYRVRVVDFGFSELVAILGFWICGEYGFGVFERRILRVLSGMIDLRGLMEGVR